MVSYLRPSDKRPHFGFVREGGVYTQVPSSPHAWIPSASGASRALFPTPVLLSRTLLSSQTISIINEDPRESVRFSILPPSSSQQPGVGKNKLRLYFRDLIKLAPGMRMFVDLVLFAAVPAKFHDQIEVGPRPLHGLGDKIVPAHPA